MPAVPPPEPKPALTLLIEGWRWILHSFSVVNHFHLLELAKRPEIRTHHIDRRYLGANWQRIAGMFPPEDEAVIDALGPPPEGVVPDACLRMAVPYDLTPADARRLLVFATSDAGHLPPDQVIGNRPLGEAQREGGAVLITPTSWSRQGLIASGADPDRVAVVPHGVDPRWLRPLSPEARRRLRQALGWEGRFVVLNIGAMSGNKGIHHIAKAVAALIPDHPELLLFLKGSDHTYRSQQSMNECLKVLTTEERARLGDRVRYNGSALSFQDMAGLYQAADAYVAPYSAEGFNMPVLEAMACGLPVICTAGGSTDDFIHPEAVLTIHSRLHRMDRGHFLVIEFDHLVSQLRRLIEDEDWRERARRVGPAWVAERYTWAKVTDRLLEVCAGAV